jgi:anaerobic selenocysteine-containing dehydrogenase
VHEQFLTDTARYADVVLPATTFLEHDDVYQQGGSSHILLGLRVIEPLPDTRPNHFVICELARRLGAEHPGFGMSEREIIDWTLKRSGWPGLEELKKARWHDCQPDFESAHYLKGFKTPSGKFRFAPDWAAFKFASFSAGVPMPRYPDHWAVIEAADGEHPFRLVTAPARNYLNTSFTETPTSQKKESRPTVKIHPADAGRLNIADGQRVRLGNRRGAVVLHAELFAGVQPGVLVSESIWPNGAFEDGVGINAVTGADPGSPEGGAAFHDNAVWLRAA